MDGIGQGLFQARVLGKVQSEAILLAAGKTVRVDDKAGLREGQWIEARLKPGTRQLAQVRTLSLKPPTLQVSEFLSQSGLPKSEANFLIAHKAMQMGLTLKPSLFENAQRFLPLLSGLNESSVHTVLLALELRLPMGAPVLDLLRRFLSRKMNFRQFLDRPIDGKSVRSWISPWLETLDEKGLDLRRMLRKLGLYDEAKLQTEAKPGSLFEDASIPKDVLRELKEFLSTYRLLMESEESPLVLVLPYLMDDQEQELVMHYEPTPEEGGGQLQIFMELSRLGPLVFQFHLRPDSLALQVRVSNEEVLDYLREKKGVLENDLQSAGGSSQINVTILLGDTSPPEFLDPADGDLKGGLNVQV